jgi:prephenate dehydrogenase
MIMRALTRPLSNVKKSAAKHSSMIQVGIIGFGSFGAFAASWLAQDFDVKVFDEDTSKLPINLRSSLEEVCKSDFVVLAIPLSAYESVLNRIKTLLPEQTVLVDVASVKEKPIKLIKKTLPNQPYIATHPLFGPESASESLSGHSLILCEANSLGVLDKVKSYGISKGLEATEMSAEAHDKEMAVVQGLTFFLARGLNEFGLHEMTLKTPSFKKLLSLAELDKHHTNELLDTILNGNKHARKVRKLFMSDLKAYNKRLR